MYIDVTNVYIYIYSVYIKFSPNNSTKQLLLPGAAKRAAAVASTVSSSRGTVAAVMAEERRKKGKLEPGKACGKVNSYIYDYD